ncbi:MAG TPA: DNA repair protein RecN [Bacillota bacterium]|nr:DNA repair protein RecN [Bacillota bacterium]HOL10087.1 DNA repair protein RecN [Bacillota bacterium]
MLQQITVRNFALIDTINLEFDPGFNVLTGETGAGKSIIIDALGLALGGRFSSEMIRTGSENAVVEAVFEINDRPELIEYLNEIGVPVTDDQTLIIQREISNNGRNRCRVNGQLVTVLVLGKIGEYLIDIHGQHEHQSLLAAEKQLELLDEYCGSECKKLRDEFLEVFRRFELLSEELQELKQNETDKVRKIDLLKFQIDEIEQMKLIIGEDEDLLKEKEILGSSEKLYEAATLSYQALYDNQSGKAVIELLAEAERSLSQVAGIDQRLAGILETIRETACQAEEASRELRDYQEQIQFDPERLNMIEERLDEINKLKRKYGASIAEILLFLDRCKQELADLNNSEERSHNLELEVQELRVRLGNLAETLTKYREAGALKLEHAIMEQLADLNMAKTQFKIGINQLDADTDTDTGVPYQGRKVQINATGADRLEFLVSPNPGESLKPLTKIASGGELSRLMLALKAILAELDQIPTMVFDEIDVGIGGRTAQAVAEKMALIGRARQVICITHLPQIASMAKNHFYIEKQVDGERTKVSVRGLMMNERIDELARMLGGAEVTDTTRQHAREMLALAEKLRLHRIGDSIMN